jgi:hypothetical protein
MTQSTKRVSTQFPPTSPLFITLSAPFLLLFAGSLLAGQSQPPNEAEKWIQQQVANGAEADLLKTFRREEHRLISSRFLLDLLAKSESSDQSAPIRIRGAIVTDPVDLSEKELGVATLRRRVTASKSFHLQPVV